MGNIPPSFSPQKHYTDSLSFVLLATMLVQTLSTMGLMALAFMAPLVAADLGVPAWIVGLQVGFIYLWAMLASPLSGVLAARWGPAKASQYALVGVAFGCLLCTSGILWLIVLGSAIAGVFYSLSNPAAAIILNSHAPAHARNIIFALKQSGVPVGWAFAGLILPALAVTYGWQSGLIGISIAMLAVAVMMQPARRTWRPDVDASSTVLQFRSYFRVGFDGDFTMLALALAGFLYSATQITVATYQVTALVEGAGWSLVAAGVALAVMQICGAIGRVLLAGIADYFSMGTMILCLTGAATAATLLLSGLLMTSASVVLVLASIGLLGFFSVSWNGTLIAQMARLSPPGRVGTMTSRLMIYYYSGAVAGPWIFSLIYNQVHSYSLTYVLLGVLPLVGAISILMAYLGDRRAAQ